MSEKAWAFTPFYDNLSAWTFFKRHTIVMEIVQIHRHARLSKVLHKSLDKSRFYINDC